jgi:hypothetical protein
VHKRSSTDDLHTTNVSVSLLPVCLNCSRFVQSASAQTTCAVTAQRHVSPRAQFLRSQGLRSWAQLPSHFPTSPTMHSVERLRRLAALPSHFRPFAIRVFESFRSPEVLGPVIQVRRLILLLVAHDTFPFPSPSKNVFRVARATRAHTDRATRSALFSACSLSEWCAGIGEARNDGSQCTCVQGVAPKWIWRYSETRRPGTPQSSETSPLANP